MSFKLIWLQLGFTCSTAADKLRFILLDSQCLRLPPALTHLVISFLISSLNSCNRIAYTKGLTIEFK